MIVKMTTISGTGTGTFSFKVNSVKNPSSTKASEPFTSIYVTDSTGYNVG